jgi:hypothetical protein
MAERPRPYAVGYGKPPVHSRFRKGASGNPRGRPRVADTEDLPGLIAQTLAEPVTVTQNGRRRRITKRAAIIAQLVNRAAQADPRATKLLLEVMRTLDRWPAAPASHDEAENARESLIRELDRLAEQETLKNAAALATIPPRPPRPPLPTRARRNLSNAALRDNPVYHAGISTARP